VPPFLQIPPHTRILLARPFSNGIFRYDGAPASLPPASSESSLTHTRRMDGFCNQNADQLGSLAGLSFPAVYERYTLYVGVVECAPDSLPPRPPPSHIHAGWMQFLQPKR
jgi:hypothetical protein